MQKYIDIYLKENEASDANIGGTKHLNNYHQCFTNPTLPNRF